MKGFSSHRWPEMTSKSGSLFTSPRKPHKILQIRRLYVHLKNTWETVQAIKGMHIGKATKHLKGVTLWKQHVPVPSFLGGWMQGCWPKRVLKFCYRCSEMQRVMLNLRVWMQILWSLSTSRWTKLPRCGAELTEPMGGLAHTRALPATERWPLLWKSRWLLSQKRSLYGRKRYSRRNWRNKNL